jgi:two-component system alkaline phosphatase synthesis response regulator PhoP
MSDNGSQRILLVDDEPDILEFISYTLKKEGFEVETALEGRSGLKKAESFDPHLILLDLMMPGMDGIEVCENIRRTRGLESVIVCFLTARSEDYSQVAGFEAGGDDYIIKPVKPKVLISRVKALLRRIHDNKDNSSLSKQKIEAGGVILDRERFLVIIDKKDIILPRKEFELLSLLMLKPGKVFSRDEIFQSVWGSDTIVGDRTIDVHIRKLREKIGNDNILTIKGVGYKFME